MDYLIAKLKLAHTNIHEAFYVMPPCYLLLGVTAEGKDFLTDCHHIAHDTYRTLSSLAIDGYAGVSIHLEPNLPTAEDDTPPRLTFALLFDSSHKYLFSGHRTWMPLNFPVHDLSPSGYGGDSTNILLTFTGHDLQIQLDLHRDAFILDMPITLPLA